MRIPLATRYADYDTKGHINNAVYLTYFEMARHHAWVTLFGKDADFSFIIAEATVKYVSEAMIGDELEIEMTTTEVRNKAWVWSYVIRSTGDSRVVAEGKTVQVMFDYEKKQTIPIPSDIRSQLNAV